MPCPGSNLSQTSAREESAALKSYDSILPFVASP
jgi:hypothetical protein